MSKRQTYPTNKIRKNYTYSVCDIADLYGITPDTVFRWIRKEGLKRNIVSKKYYVHSSDLKRFLEKRNRKNKHPCEDHEMFCCKCKKPQTPQKNSLKFKVNPNKVIRVYGLCRVCNTKTNKIVGANKWSENHPLYPVKDDPIEVHSGEQESPHKCQTKIGENYCLNIAAETNL